MNNFRWAKLQLARSFSSALVFTLVAVAQAQDARQIVEEGGHIGISLLVDGAAPAAEVQDGGRWNRLFRCEPGLVSNGFQGFKIAAGQGLAALQFALHNDTRRGEFDGAIFVAEFLRQTAFKTDTVDAFDKIHEPVAAMHFAVGAHLETGVALQRDRIFDGARFGGPQLLG